MFASSPFVNASSLPGLCQILEEVIEGVNISSNEERLRKMRQTRDYELVLCTELTQDRKPQTNKKVKTLMALELRKIERIANDQCWWMIRDVFYSENDKLSNQMKLVCLRSNNVQYTRPVFVITVENIGVYALQRHFCLAFALLKQYGSCDAFNQLEHICCIIIKNCVEVLNMGEYIEEHSLIEHSLILLTMLQKLLPNCETWENYSLTSSVEAALESHRQSAIVSVMSRVATRNFEFSTISEENRFKTEVQECVEICLLKTCAVEQTEADQVYYECLQAMRNHVFQSSLFATHAEWLVEALELCLKFMEKQLIENEFALFENTDDMPQEEAQTECQRYFIADAILAQLSINLLKERFGPFFEIKMVELAIFVPNIVQLYSSITSCLTGLLSQVVEVLQTQETVGFFEERRLFLLGIFKYLMKYRKKIEIEHLLQICSALDLLAFKCECTSKLSYEIIDELSEELTYVEANDLMAFVKQSLERINQNLFLDDIQNYSHVLKLMRESLSRAAGELSIEDVNNRCGESLPGQEWSIEYPPLSRQILIMIEKVVRGLGADQFCHQLLNRLNELLGVVLESRELCWMGRLIPTEVMTGLVELNFKHEVFDRDSALVFFEYCQVSGKFIQFMDSLEVYQLWENFESERIEFYVGIYLKFISANCKFFCSSEQESRLVVLKRNLWHRFVAENDPREVQQLQQIFHSHQKYFHQLLTEYERIRAMQSPFQQPSRGEQADWKQLQQQNGSEMGSSKMELYE